MTEKVRLVLCRKCNTPFAKTEKRCPECGKKQGNFFTRWAWIPTLVLLVVAAYFALSEYREYKTEQERIAVWDELIIQDKIPELTTRRVVIERNKPTEFELVVYSMSERDYYTYVDVCKQLGYTEFAETSSYSGDYTAYDATGCKLSLSYTDYSERMEIALKVPEDMGTYTWPTSNVAKLLPKPVSTTGKVHSSYDSSLRLSVSNMTKEMFEDYVQACIGNGFNVDSTRGLDYYRADHPAGYHLSLKFDKSHVTEINVSEIKEESPAEETVSVKPTATPKITTVPKPVTPEKTAVSSKTTYDFALVKRGSSYDQYYLLDYDSKTAVYFCTNGDSVLEGKMTGTMRPKLVITYHAGGDTWSESMKYKSGSSTVVVMTDHNGFDWEFEVTDVATAVQYLPGVEASSTDWVHWTAFPQATSTPKSTATPKPTQKLVNGMRPEFKAAMDEYEEFFDDYVELMKKLEKNPDDPMLLLKSAKFVVQYAETMEALENWEDDDLNSKELNYYITVTNRINKKLLEVAK